MRDFCPCCQAIRRIRVEPGWAIVRKLPFAQGLLIGACAVLLLLNDLSSSAAQLFSPASASNSASLTASRGQGVLSLADRFLSSPSLEPFMESTDARGIVIGDPHLFWGLHRVRNRRSHGQFFILESKEASTGGLQSVEYTYMDHGSKLLGVTETISIRGSRNFEFMFQGWYVPPFDVKGHTRYEFVGARKDAERDWQAECSGLSVDLSVAMDVAQYTRKSLLLGIRSDSYWRDFTSPGNPSSAGLGVPWAASPSDSVRIRAWTWTPYVGFQWSPRGTAGRGTMRLIFAPVVLGNLVSEESWGVGGTSGLRSSLKFNKGNFFELFGNYEYHVVTDGYVGLFLKAHATSAYGNGDLDNLINGSGSTGQRYHITYRQIAYNVGASLSVRFSSAWLLPSALVW